jgi:hypothetical protein
MTDIFISHPSPFNVEQQDFLNLLQNYLAQFSLNPVNLGQNNWSYKNPMRPIKNMMKTCKGAVIIGLERQHCFIGYEKEKSDNEIEFIHRYQSSPWIHIEAGMAYQKGLPLLILKEKKIHAEGILDPISTDYFVFDFELKNQKKKLSIELRQIIDSWMQVLKR